MCVGVWKVEGAGGGGSDVQDVQDAAPRCCGRGAPCAALADARTHLLATAACARVCVSAFRQEQA